MTLYRSWGCIGDGGDQRGIQRFIEGVKKTALGKCFFIYNKFCFNIYLQMRKIIIACAPFENVNPEGISLFPKKKSLEMFSDWLGDSELVALQLGPKLKSHEYGTKVDAS
jgi:hypothetical protein